MRSLHVVPAAQVMRPSTHSNTTFIPAVSADVAAPGSRRPGPDRPGLGSKVKRSRKKITVVSAATVSTTNITGFLIISRGSSLTKAERIAGTTIFGSSIAEAVACFCSFMVSMDVNSEMVRSEQGVGVVGEVLDDRSERERREEGKTADDQDDADDETDEQAAGGRQCAGRGRDRLLVCQRARQRHRRH